MSLSIKLTSDPEKVTGVENRNGFCVAMKEVVIKDIGEFKYKHNDSIETINPRVRLHFVGQSNRSLRGGFSIFQADFLEMCSAYLQLHGFNVTKKSVYEITITNELGKEDN